MKISGLYNGMITGYIVTYTSILMHDHHPEQIGHVVTSWVTPYSESLSLHASRSPQMSLSC